jgi:hypothetical protein
MVAGSDAAWSQRFSTANGRCVATFVLKNYLQSGQQPPRRCSLRLMHDRKEIDHGSCDSDYRGFHFDFLILRRPDDPPWN